MNNSEIRELSALEVEEVNGGFFISSAIAVTIVIAAAAAGYQIGSNSVARDERRAGGMCLR